MFKRYVLSDIDVDFHEEPASGRIGIQLHPSALRSRLRPRRQNLNDESFINSIPGMEGTPAWRVDPLVQIKVLGDPYSGSFAQGRTMRNSPSVDRFRLVNQKEITANGRTEIVTSLVDPSGLSLSHHISWQEGDQAIRITTNVVNRSTEAVTLEMLSSFSLGGLSPFDPGDSAGRLRVHRFRSGWSAEGRCDTRSVEDLHLERSWHGGAMFSERFGQVGSLPVREWFPFLAVEDIKEGVTWAVQLVWAGSWQMEIFRQHDDICVSGGLADREFGHWSKTLHPGDSICSPTALVTCVAGTLEDACDRLTRLHHEAADTHPVVESNLPIIFNEWCSTWGDPSHEKLLAVAKRLSDSPTRYLVIDAGWYKDTGSSNFFYSHGDWVPNTDLFPCGLEQTAAAIRKEGLIPGLWFEFETCGKDSTAFHLVDHLLKRDGIPVTCMGRRFWDMTDPFVRNYLSEKVIDLLDRCGFGYLKVDYNETIGLGSDHPDGLGEGLRLQIEGVHHFFDLMRKRLPDLVIENCSSGGHRLEPSMLARSAMSSFSDAHELPEIPIIAASLHALMLPRQSQIWAVLRPTDSKARLTYSLAATFLGRMCLSGGIAELSSDQWNLVREAQELYVKAAPTIKHGRSHRFGEIAPSWRHPEGWQVLRRISDDGENTLVVAHSFANSPVNLCVPLPEGNWRIQGNLGGHSVSISHSTLTLAIGEDFRGRVILLEKVSTVRKSDPYSALSAVPAAPPPTVRQTAL